MPSRFYDPNDNERKRLLRATATDPDNNRRFTDTVGRSGFERIDGDLRMRVYDGENGGVRFEQRGRDRDGRPEWRSFDSTTPIAALQNPDRTGQIAPDRTGADRLARAVVDNSGWDRLATPEQRGLAGVGAIGGAGMLQRARESGFVVNPNDLLHERSFGTNAVLASRARGFGGAPTAVEMFGTDAQNEAAQGIYDRAREQYLMDQAGLNGLARSAAGGSEGRAAALRELEAMRLQRAQANAQQNADLARREGLENERTVAGITAKGKVDAAAANAKGLVDAAKERGQAYRDAGTARNESNERIAKMQQEEAAKRPVALGGGVGAVPDGQGGFKTIGETNGKTQKEGLHTLKPGQVLVTDNGEVRYDSDPGNYQPEIDAKTAELNSQIGALVPDKERIGKLKKEIEDLRAKQRAARRNQAGAGAAPAGGGLDQF